MIPAVYQNCQLEQVVGSGFEVIDVVRPHLVGLRPAEGVQALVIQYIRFSAVDKEWESQSIHSKRSFDAIGCFVEAKPFRFHTGITGVLHRLRIDQQQPCPFCFFLTCSRT